eukprot:GEZU01016059.1.p1 GENE.GEZU01016059.1~~GEZU01016059.1.p1  ORF type:complete len:528 (+),score=123.07 GEZU01016059.1:379-1962(+)
MIGRHQHRIMLQNVRSAAKTALRNRQTLLRIIHQTANNKANHFSTLASATSTDFKYTTKIDRFNPYLPNLSDYNTVRKSFRWNIPAKYNIGVDICDKHAVTHPDSLAIIYEDATGKVAQFSFGDLKDYSDRLANAFVAKCGMRIGDRVAILLPQSPETAIAHIATYKMGGIALPLFTLFGPDAVQYRLNNSEAKTLVTSEDCLEKILKIKDDLPHLKNIVLVIDSTTSSKTPLPTIPDINIYNFWDLLENASPHFTPVDSNADDPALIIYTSGTTGNPKGCLHAHRVLPGHLPGVEFPHNFFPQNGDCFWTPADWAWIGGLIDVLLPSLLHGVPVLAHRATKFDPEHAFYLMAKHNVRNVFMPPTALKMMRQVENPHLRHNYRLRSIGSGGESLGEEILEWGKKTFNGLNINEFYGQTEANLLLGNCSAIMPVKPGSMGVAIPGREIEVVNEDGDVLPNGTVGTVAVRRGDPVMFLKYWNNPEATEKKFTKNGEWMMTGDLARKDETGYVSVAFPSALAAIASSNRS